jgi:competence protein ComEC
VRPVGENRGWIGNIHRRTDVALGYGLRPREAAVVRGMVLGDRSLMPEELQQSFQRSGITHVLATWREHRAIHELLGTLLPPSEGSSCTPPVNKERVTHHIL